MNPYIHSENLKPCDQQFAINLGSLDSSHREDTFRVLAWIQDNAIPYEIHAARIRFRPHTEQLLLEYYLRWEQYCYTVDQPYPSVF